MSVFFPGFCLAGHVLGASAVLLCLPSLILRAGRERLGVKGDEKEGLFRCSSLRKTRWKISSFTLRWKCRSLSDRQNQINCQVFFRFFSLFFIEWAKQRDKLFLYIQPISHFRFRSLSFASQSCTNRHRPYPICIVIIISYLSHHRFSARKEHLLDEPVAFSITSSVVFLVAYSVAFIIKCWFLPLSDAVIGY